MRNTQKLHLPFCQELKNNISLICPDTKKRSNWSVPFPKLALFKVNTNFASGVWSSFGGSNYVELEGIKFIDDLVIEKVQTESFSDITQGAYFAFIAPHDFLTATDKKKSTRCYYYDQIKGQITFAENEGQKWFKEQSHLAEHSTFQLFFLDGILGTYNLGKMDYEIQEGKVIINYVLVVKATPSGTLFKFQSGEISPPIRWELAVKGNVITMKVFQEIFKGGVKGFWNKIKSPLLRIGGGIVGGMVGGPGGAAAGSAAGSAVAGNDKEEKSGNVSTNKGIEEAMGLVNVKGGKASEEQQTKRWLEAVGRTDEFISDPTLYYTNDIGFSYNFFDFWMRLNEWDRILTSRLVFSSDLYNNLVHNNHENPITYPLNITFSKLGKILKKGYYQGKLTLDYDPGGRMAECFAQGVTFYEDKEKDFPDPNLGVSQQSSTSLYSLGGFGDTYTAQAIVEPGEGITVNIPYTADQRGYSHSTFIRLTNSSVMDNFKNAVVSSSGCNSSNLHYDSSNGFCWGCTYDELKKHNFVQTKFTPSSDCSVILKLDVNSSETKDLDLKAGTEYTVTITETQFIFKAQDKTKIIIQKVPNQDDFNNLDWNPPLGSGGDTEIPLSDPSFPEPEPGADNIPPEPDFPPPDLDPFGGGEPEITIEPDITPDPEPDLPIEPDVPEPEIPEPDITPPDTDPGKDPDPSKDPDKGDPDPGEGDKPEKPEDFD